MTSSPFHAGELDAQQRWGNPELWTEARINQLIWDRIPEEIHVRIEAAPFFFLATSSPNGAYASLGNILLNPYVSMLFIDFSDGARLRVNGKASIHENAAMMAPFPQAECVVVVDIELVAPSCPAYIPRLVPAELLPGAAE